MLLKSNVASHIDSTLTFYSSLAPSLKPHFADGYFWQDPKSQYASLCWAGRRDRNSGCVSESTILKSQKERRKSSMKAWIFAEGTGNDSSIWCISKTVGRTGLGTAFVKNGFNPANRKTLSFRVSLLIHTRCLWISQRHYSFSLGSSLWKRKKMSLQRRFLCTHKSYFQNES